MNLVITDHAVHAIPASTSVSTPISTPISTPTSTPISTQELTGDMLAQRINLSGSRRFTSQRVVLYAMLAANNYPNADCIAEEALNRFREAHTTLIKGNKMLPGVLSEELQEAYFGASCSNEKILNFISLAERALFGIASGWRHQVPALLNELVEASSLVLTDLNLLTAIYEREARSNAQQVECQLHEAMDEIKTISKRAQVVAINARIVAAHAGHSGVAFGVVATELITMTADIDTIVDAAMAKAA